MVRIAQFNHSETGGINGQPGDQLKVPGTYERAETFNGELEVVRWYGPWQFVFRAIDANTAKLLAKKAIDTCRNPHVGYSQWNPESPRTTFYNELKKAGWDPSKIKTDCNGDCSAGMAAWLCSVGIEVSIDMWTGNEREIIEETGKFLTLTDPLFTDQDSYLMPGDILLREGHTCMVVDTGDNVKSSIPGMATANSWQRYGPSTSAKKIDVVHGEEAVDGYLPIMSGKWWITESYGRRGWESEKYLEWLYYVDITGFMVNVRSRPTINSKVLDTAQLGERFLSTGISAEDGRGIVWYQIMDGDELGWVSSVYAELGGYI